MTHDISRRHLLASGAALLAGASQAQPAPTPAPALSAADARSDLRLLQRAFTALHPGLHRYASAEQIEAEFATADAAVAQGSSRAAMFVLVSRLAAAVHCGHTWTNPSNQRHDLADALFARADKLPLALRWVQGRVLISGSAAPGVDAGSELLAIDGRPVADIAALLLPLLRADGRHAGSVAKRLSQLDSGAGGGAMDRLYPACCPPQAGRYTLTLRSRPDAAALTLAVDPTTVEARQRALPAVSSDWHFAVDGDTGLLTLPTFAFWRSSFDAPAFLARSFDALRGVPYLIIDQRRNEGGDDAIGRALLAHLLRAPAVLPGHRVESAYERVPYALARYLDTWDFGFFDRTGQAVRGPGRNWLLADAPARRVEPVAQPYGGRTLLLVGPQNSSAGFLLARDVQRSAAATLLGQTTGGNLRGLNGGQLAWLTLPNSGVAVDIPLLAAFAPGDPPDAGVEPDIAVAPRWADAVAGVDTELQTARRQIAAWGGAAAR